MDKYFSLKKKSVRAVIYISDSSDDENEDDNDSENNK